MSQHMTGTMVHTFEWERVQRNVRFVIDIESWMLTAAQVQRAESAESFEAATRYEMKDIEQFLERDHTIYKQPLEFGLIACERGTLPVWVIDC